MYIGKQSLGTMFQLCFPNELSVKCGGGLSRIRISILVVSLVGVNHG